MNTSELIDMLIGRVRESGFYAESRGDKAGILGGRVLTKLPNGVDLYEDHFHLILETEGWLLIATKPDGCLFEAVYETAEDAINVLLSLWPPDANTSES